MSTVDGPQYVRAEHSLDHEGREHTRHQHPGERERIAFNAHQFEHGCYGQPCAEADRLYAEWQAALAASR